MSKVTSIQEEQQTIAAAFMAWKDTYEITNPPPEFDDVERDDEWWGNTRVVWWSIIFCLSLFVASRTGWGIYKVNVSEGFPPTFAVAVAVVGVYAIEGLLVMFGLHRPRKLNQTRVQEILDRSISWVAIVIGLTVSAVSGFEVSKNASDTLGTIFGIPPATILVYTLGIGMSFVLYGITEFIGRRKWVGENLPLILKREHREDLVAWRAERQAEWETSAVYLDIVSEREIRKKQAQFDIQKANYKRTGVLRAKRDAEAAQYAAQFNEASVKDGEDKPRKTYPRGYKTDLVKEYMNKHATPEHSPTLNEIKTWAEQQGVSVSNGTISQARSEWYETQDPFQN